MKRKRKGFPGDNTSFIIYVMLVRLLFVNIRTFLQTKPLMIFHNYQVQPPLDSWRLSESALIQSCQSSPISDMHEPRAISITHLCPPPACLFVSLTILTYPQSRPNHTIQGLALSTSFRSDPAWALLGSHDRLWCWTGGFDPRKPN